MNKFFVEEGEIGEQSNFGMGELELLNTKLFFSIGKWNAKPRSAGARDAKEFQKRHVPISVTYIYIKETVGIKTYKYVR